MHLFRDLPGVLLDGTYIFFGNVYGRDDARGISGVHACKFDMFHDCRHKCMISVTNGVCFTFQGMIKEAVDEDRAVRRHSNGGFHIAGHAFGVIYDLHTASAKDIGRTDHHRIADLVCDRERFIYGCCHSGFRHRDLKLVHHLAEQITIFRKINDGRSGSKDLYTIFLKFGSEIQRSLSAELRDDAYRLFFFIDA